MFAQPHTSAAADIYNLTISQKPQTDKAKTPVFLFLRLTLPKLRRRIFKDAKFTLTRGYFISKWGLIKFSGQICKSAQKLNLYPLLHNLAGLRIVYRINPLPITSSPL